jgi:hypothetical protein
VLNVLKKRLRGKQKEEQLYSRIENERERDVERYKNKRKKEEQLHPRIENERERYVERYRNRRKSQRPIQKEIQSETFVIENSSSKN